MELQYFDVLNLKQKHKIVEKLKTLIDKRWEMSRHSDRKSKLSKDDYWLEI